MAPTDKTEEKHWFILNFIHTVTVTKPQNYIDLFNKDGERVELFAPRIKSAHTINGKVVFIERPLTFHYVFVRGTLGDVKELCAAQGNGFSFMLDHSSTNRYGIISDSTMENFKMIARMYSNSIPFYNISDIELEAGDTVEVVDGEYAGLTGVFMPKSRSNNGNLVIAATSSLGAVVWNVNAKYIRILEFARNTRRQYDLLDSFIPKLFPILRKYHDGEKLTQKEISLLVVFNQRMGVVAPENQKLEAKLLATLICVQYILGDMTGYSRSLQRFQKREQALTNKWTRALAMLILSVSHNDLAKLPAAYDEISHMPEKPTVTQSQLLAEYRHYLHTDS